MSNLSQTHYIIDSITGVPMFGCSHAWDSKTRPTCGGKTIVERTCVACGRYEQWLQLSRPRPALKF